MSPAIGWPSVSVTCSVASVAPALFVALNAGAWKDYFGSETRSDLQRAEWILFRFCGRFGTRRFSSVHVVFFLRAVCVCVCQFLCQRKTTTMFFSLIQVLTHYVQQAGGRGISGCSLCQRSSTLEDQVNVPAVGHLGA